MVRQWLLLQAPQLLLLLLASPSLLVATDDDNTNLIISPVQDALSDEASVEDEEFLSGVDSYNADDVFVPTNEWKEVLPGQVVPAGLHVRINLTTGKKEAKLLEREGDHSDQDQNGEKNRTEAEQSIGAIDDGGESKGRWNDGLRSYQELHRQKQMKDVAFNTEFEMVQVLVDKFDNSTGQERLDALDDLEYYLHQYDNARDFVTIGGLESVVRPALTEMTRPEEERATAAMVFCACVQSHHEVKERVAQAGWVSTLVQSLETDESPLVRRRVVYALSCLLRGHSRSKQIFNKEGGYGQLMSLLSNPEESPATAVKVLVLLSDLLQEDAAGDVRQALGQDRLCPALAGQVQKLTTDDLTGLERLSLPIRTWASLCSKHLLPQMTHLENLISGLANVSDPDGDLGISSIISDLRGTLDTLSIAGDKDEL